MQPHDEDFTDQPEDKEHSDSFPKRLNNIRILGAEPSTNTQACIVLRMQPPSSRDVEILQLRDPWLRSAANVVLRVACSACWLAACVWHVCCVVACALRVQTC